MKREFELPVAGPALSRKRIASSRTPYYILSGCFMNSSCLPATWGTWLSGHDIGDLCEVLGALSAHSGCSISLTWLFLFLVHKITFGYCPVSWGLHISLLNVVFQPCCQLLESRCFILCSVFVLLLRIKDFNFNLPRVEEKIRHASEILWL